MQYKLIETKNNTKGQISGFYGLNRTEKGEYNEFSDMLNMSSDCFPCLAPAKTIQNVLTQDNIRAVISPKYTNDDEIKAFTGVAGTSFYYNGKEIPFESEDMSITEGISVTLVDFNGRIVICAYDDRNGKSIMYYYGYTATDENKVKRMEKGAYGIICTAYSSGNPDRDASVTNYLTATGVDWTEYFSVGDAVYIDGFKNEKNNTIDLDSRYKNVSKDRAISCIVEKVTSSKLYLQLYNYLHTPLVLEKEKAENVNIYIKIPTMNHVCIHNNRLWGTNPNGEYLYASKQGDCFNFNTFQGLANDSFYCEVGTAGGVVGIVSYRDNLVAFKRDCIHHIYGDKPSNFTMPKQLSDCGCIDIRSALQIGTALYFLGYGGFYKYVGGQPELISRKLNKKYKAAVATTDGQKYIVSAKCSENDGGGELLVYDTQYGLWYKETYIDYVDSFRWHNRVYVADKKSIFEYGACTPQSWECKSTVIYDDMFDNKGMTELWIRAKISDGARIDVYTSEDGGDFLKRGTLNGKGTLKVYRIPIRFINGEYYQYRLDGYGSAVIYDIERVISSGGRGYRKG